MPNLRATCCNNKCLTILLAILFGYYLSKWINRQDNTVKDEIALEEEHQIQEAQSPFLQNSRLSLLDEIGNFLWPPIVELLNWPPSKHSRLKLDLEYFGAQPLDAPIVEELFKRRRQLVEDTCKIRKPRDFVFYGKPSMSLLFRLGKQTKQFLLVDDRHKMILCSIAKVASTSWRRFLVEVGSKETGIDISSLLLGINDTAIHSSPNITDQFFRPLGSYKADDMLRRLKNYTKVVFVRNPLDRLVASWKAKLAVKNSYYNTLLGGSIIKNYRPNADNASIAAGYPVSLSEFFQFFAKLTDRTYHDVHWAPYFQHCGICSIKYDYIGHFEAIGFESEFIMEQLIRLVRSSNTAAGDLEFPVSNRMAINNNDTPEQFMSDVPTAAQLSKVSWPVLKAVIRKLDLDFDMFGYELPEFAFE